MVAQTRIALATSIPPRLVRMDRGVLSGAEYQRRCIESWTGNGFRVLSLNAEDEIPDLSKRYPEVSFVPVKRVSERKTPLIADLLGTLLEGPESCFAIVNADILLEPTRAWGDELPDVVQDCLVAIQRHDTSSLIDGALRRYYWGYDCFVFGRKTAEAAQARAGGFAMGLPWWDYWFPALAMLMGGEVRLMERPYTVPLAHPQGYRNATLQRYAREFARSVLSEAANRELKSDLSAILPMCRELLATPVDLNDMGAEDRSLSDSFAHQLVPWRDAFCANTFRLEAERSHDKAFQHLEERIWAGQAYESARYHAYLGNPSEEARLYGAALQKTPFDFDVLFALGVLQCRQGDSGGAIELLSRALDQNPHSARVLNALGFALRSAGRREQAVLHFEAALSADPDLREAAFNLSVTLYELGRMDEALASAEAVLMRWPDAAELQQLRMQFERRA